jgi:hypothetical protein
VQDMQNEMDNANHDDETKWLLPAYMADQPHLRKQQVNSSPPPGSPGGPARPAATPTLNKQKVQNMVCNETSMSRLEGGGG